MLPTLDEVYHTYTYGPNGVAVFVYPDPRVVKEIIPALERRGGRVMQMQPGDVLRLPDRDINIHIWTVAVDNLDIPTTQATSAYIRRPWEMGFEEYLNRMFSTANSALVGGNYTQSGDVRPVWYDIDMVDDPPN